MWAYVEILLICNFHPSRARNYATTITSKLNNFAEVLAVRVHVNVYMATPALRSLIVGAVSAKIKKCHRLLILPLF